MRCTATKVTHQPRAYVCSRCSTNWFDSTGAPHCFAPVEKGHEVKLKEVTAKVQETITKETPYYEGADFQAHYEKQFKSY